MTKFIRLEMIAFFAFLALLGGMSMVWGGSWPHPLGALVDGSPLPSRGAIGLFAIVFVVGFAAEELVFSFLALVASYLEWRLKRRLLVPYVAAAILATLAIGWLAMPHWYLGAMAILGPRKYQRLAAAAKVVDVDGSRENTENTDGRG